MLLIKDEVHQKMIQNYFGFFTTPKPQNPVRMY